MRALERRVPPVVLALCAAGLMWVIDRRLPQLRILFPWRATVSVLLLTAGALIGLSGVVEFRRFRASVNPLRPGVAGPLVMTGIFRLTRNPMYLALVLGLLGWGWWLSNPASLVIVPVVVVYLNRFQIGPEERALEAYFASDFREYCQRVRRWF